MSPGTWLSQSPTVMVRARGARIRIFCVSASAFAPESMMV